MYRKTITTLIVLGLLGVLMQPALAAENPTIKDLDARLAAMAADEYSEAEKVEILNGIIREIIGTLPADQQARYLSETIARAARYLDAGAPLVIGTVSGRISDRFLPILSAAAVLSAGGNSPTMLNRILAGQAGDEARVALVMDGARKPLSYLDAETAAAMQPRELMDPAAERLPPADNELQVEREPLTVTVTKTLALEPESTVTTTANQTPPQPPAIPPRPPAIPYRGQ